MSDTRKQIYFKFLDKLRKSGKTNMLGAGSYLEKKFPELSRKESRGVLNGWMETFNDGKKDKKIHAEIEEGKEEKKVEAVVVDEDNKQNSKYHGYTADGGITRAKKVEVLMPWETDGIMKNVIVPDRFLIVSEDTGEFFASVSDEYQLLQHETALVEVESIINGNPEFGEHIKTVDYSDNGARMSAKYRFPKVQIDISTNGKSDLQDMQIYVRNSYDRSMAFSIGLGAYRVICSNGLIIGKKLLFERSEHVQNLNVQKITMELNNAIEIFSAQEGIWKEWAKTVIDKAQARDMLEKVKFAPTQEAEIVKTVEEQKKKDLTKWVLYNIITAYITHKIDSFGRKTKLNDRLRSTFE